MKPSTETLTSITTWPIRHLVHAAIFALDDSPVGDFSPGDQAVRLGARWLLALLMTVTVVIGFSFPGATRLEAF